MVKGKKCKKYYIYRAYSLKGKYTYIGTSTTTKYKDKKVKLQNKYYYKIKALNGNKYKASNLSKAKSINFKFEGKLIMPNEITIYTDCFTYIPVGKGNSKEHIVINNKIDGLYTMESVTQEKPGDNISDLVLQYDGPISEDIVFNAKVCYYKYPWIDKYVLIRIKDSSKVPAYKQNSAVPDFGAYTGIKAYSTDNNGKVVKYKLSTTQYFDYLDLLKKRGFKEYKKEETDRGKCTYYRAPNGASLSFLIEYIDFDNTEITITL